jgi:molecular chaperone GrpE (heat shock protein)
MKRTGQNQHGETSRELIGEMMLAKTVLEEKNQIIDRKDRTIRGLLSELEALKQELQNSARQLDGVRKSAHQQGMRTAIEDIICLVACYQDPGAGVENMLAARLIMLFKEKYGLEVLENAPVTIDPEIHQVIEVEQAADGGSSIQVISKGFRIAGKLIRPMRVKVIKGKEGTQLRRVELRMPQDVARSAVPEV